MEPPAGAWRVVKRCQVPHGYAEGESNNPNRMRLRANRLIWNEQPSP
jgi:hypothetical protein